MDLHSIQTVSRPASAAELAPWEPGDAWLAGGTWLFSEPQPALNRLVDLQGLNWTPIEASAAGLSIAATCRIADVAHYQPPLDLAASWPAITLLRDCCNAFLASFKIWNTATVGGNICMSLPAGPMISLAAALDGTCIIWPAHDGARQTQPRSVKMVDFVTGNHANVLQPGELLRSIELPAAALGRRVAMRHMSLVKLGRSAALIIGTRAANGAFALAITAATDRPVQLRYPATPDAATLDAAITALPHERWFDDVNGSANYKRHVTRHFATEILAELKEA